MAQLAPEPDIDGRWTLAEAERIPRWATRLPTVFVILSLLALLLIPILMGQRISALREEITDVAEPARDLVDDVELALAREGLAVRGFLLAGEPEFRDFFFASNVAADSSLAALRELLTRLGPETTAHLGTLRAAKDQWLAPHLEALHGRLPPEELIARLPDQQARYLETIEAAKQLHRAIMRAAEVRRGQIVATERLGMYLTALLILLALLSTLLTFWSGRRLRALTERLEHRASLEDAVPPRRSRRPRGRTRRWPPSSSTSCSWAAAAARSSSRSPARAAPRRSSPPRAARPRCSTGSARSRPPLPTRPSGTTGPPRGSRGRSSPATRTTTWPPPGQPTCSWRRCASRTRRKGCWSSSGARSSLPSATTRSPGSASWPT